MKTLTYIIACLAFFQVSCSESEPEDEGLVQPVEPVESRVEGVQFYLTKGDKSLLFSDQSSILRERENTSGLEITINESTTYQEIDGFGFTLTGGSATHLNGMSTSNRSELLKELFSNSDENIGLSYLRISIGASDLDSEPFTYNDLTAGETDEDLSEFSIDRDKENLIPVLKEILAINPAIKILATPWSAPDWMKSNRNSVGGSLLSKYFSTYSDYFVKYIEAMSNEGITIDAVSVQNEPLHDGNNPSMLMVAADQLNFVKNHLGPKFQSAGLSTKIILYDHNPDRVDYPISILQDSQAKEFVDGSAFHLYAGQISALTQVHNAAPDKNIYFTEQWVGSPSNFAGDLKWHLREVLIGATRNWSKNALGWNLTSDSNLQPHTNGGCTKCLGALTIDADNVQRNVGYYIMAHASKYVVAGSVRIKSNYLAELPNVAFKRPDGDLVLIVLNDSNSSLSFNLRFDDRVINPILDAGAVGTFVLEQ